MDADLSHDPKYIPEMLNEIIQKDADIVIGSRYVKEGGIDGWSFFRKLNSRVANYLANFILQTRIKDLTNSFRIYKRSVF